MNNKKYVRNTLLAFFVIHFFILPSFAQKKYVVGRVLNDLTRQGVNNVSVLNKRTTQMARTNHQGNFFLWVVEGDSIIATSNSHGGRMGIVWDGKTEEPIILMQKQAISLPEVVIRTKRDETLQREIDKLLKEPEAHRNLSGEEAFALAESPITLLYELFSKRAKSDRKVAVLMQQDRRRRYANLRMEAIALKTTDYRGQQLEDFKRFCGFSEDFLLHASEYDLTYITLKSLKQYEKVAKSK